MGDDVGRDHGEVRCKRMINGFDDAFESCDSGFGN